MMQKTIWISLAGAAIIIASVVLLQNILFPFIAAFAIAYFLDPLCDRLERVGFSRTWATASITFAFFILLAAFIGFIAPILYSELVALLTQLPNYWETLKAQVNVPMVQDLWQNQGEDYSKDIATFMVKKLQSLGAVFSGIGVVFNVLSLWFITPLVAFYLLRDWDRLVEYCDNLIPKRHRKVIRTLAKDIDTSLSNYVRGQFFVCVILGMFLGLALWLIAVPYGFVIGLLSGLLSFIPYLGQIVGALVAVAIAYVTTASWGLPLSVMGIFALGNILEGFILVPRLLGKSIGIHAVWVLFALLASASLFGFIGLLLALPMAAGLSVLVKFAIARYKQGAFYKSKQ